MLTDGMLTDFYMEKITCYWYLNHGLGEEYWIIQFSSKLKTSKYITLVSEIIKQIAQTNREGNKSVF